MPKTNPTNRFTNAPLDPKKQKKKETAAKWYRENKDAILKHQKQYRTDLKDGKRKPTKGTQIHKEMVRKKDRTKKRRSNEAKREKERQERIAEYLKQFGGE
jgi:hypothetical protein